MKKKNKTISLKIDAEKDKDIINFFEIHNSYKYVFIKDVFKAWLKKEKEKEGNNDKKTSFEII